MKLELPTLHSFKKKSCAQQSTVSLNKMQYYYYIYIVYLCFVASISQNVFGRLHKTFITVNDNFSSEQNNIFGAIVALKFIHENHLSK